MISNEAESNNESEQTLEVNPNLAELYVKWAVSLREFQCYHESLQAANIAIGLNPNLAEAHMARGIVLRLLRDYPEALNACDKTIALNPKLARAHAERAINLRILQRYIDSLEAADTAIELNPNWAEAHAIRGVTLRLLQNYQEALNAFNQAIKLNPKLEKARIESTEILNSFGYRMEILTSLYNLLQTNLTEGEKYTKLGEVFALFGLPNEAVEMFKIAKDKEIAAVVDNPVPATGPGRQSSITTSPVLSSPSQWLEDNSALSVLVSAAEGTGPAFPINVNSASSSVMPSSAKQDRKNTQPKIGRADEGYSPAKKAKR